MPELIMDNGEAHARDVWKPVINGVASLGMESLLDASERYNVTASAFEFLV